MTELTLGSPGLKISQYKTCTIIEVIPNPQGLRAEKFQLQYRTKAGRGIRQVEIKSGDDLRHVIEYAEDSNNLIHHYGEKYIRRFRQARVRSVAGGKKSKWTDWADSGRD